MCGIFGCSGVDVDKALKGLFCLQHRGPQSAGIAVWNDVLNEINDQRRIGYVEHLREKINSTEFPGSVAVCHTRYGTTGQLESLRNAQPIVKIISGKKLAVAHNGDLVKVEWGGKIISITELRKELEKQGVAFETDSDTEIIPSLIAQTKGDMISRILTVLDTVYGAFSLLFLWRGYLIAARDPWGFRPLAMGRCNTGYAFASENCAFDQLDEIEFIREVEPGEVIVITPDLEMKTYKLSRKVKLAFCSFEKVYFARPDSHIFGQSVSSVRKKFGKTIAKEMIEAGILPEADLVVPILDSGRTAAREYAYEAGIPLDFGLIRNHYSGRNFITAGQDTREEEVNLKHNVDKEVLRGVIKRKIGEAIEAAKKEDEKVIVVVRIVIMDDSIVRGTTSRTHVKKIRQAAEEVAEEVIKELIISEVNVVNLEVQVKVHVVIPSPPVAFPCYYGIETKTRKELIAANNDLEGIREFVGADSLIYLSLEGFKKCLGKWQDYCLACFDGDYPIPID